MEQGDEPEQKPKLKLSFTKPAPPAGGSSEPPPSATSTTKLKLKFGGKKSEPSETPPTEPKTKPKAKPARKPKPTAKKRAAEEEIQSEDEPISDADDAAGQAPKKRIKLSFKPLAGAGLERKSSMTPYLKLNAKGKAPHRPIGVGYDSEDSDREKDPTIIENIILRMLPGDDCKYLREAVENKRFGPVKDGGADVRMRFISKDGRRATITIKGRMYAAILVDLPCVIEAMKSWEKKSWWKSADICQMLLVLGQCKNEDEALSYPLPSRRDGLNEKTWAWAHGITPPLRWVRKRRFRKRVSVKAVEQDEREVERLLALDDECVEGTSKWKVYENADEYEREVSQAQFSSSVTEENEDQDAEGEVVEAEEEMDSDEQAEHIAELMRMDDMDAPPEENAGVAATDAATSSAMPTPSGAGPAQSPPSSAAPSPAIAQVQSQDSPAAATTSEDDEDDEEESSEEEEEQITPAESDPEALEAEQELQRQKEDIADLEAMIARERAKLAVTTNAMLRSKVQGKIEALNNDLEVRKRTMGIEDGDESEAE